MKLLRVHIISADTCAGLLDDIDLWLRNPLMTMTEYSQFDPVCLIGPNGAGKSQFLQVLAEIFQSVFHAFIDKEERLEGNTNLQFEIEYLIRPENEKNFVHIRISRKSTGRRRPTIAIQRKHADEWIECLLNDPITHTLLPQKIVGYTSGQNETLSLPFLISRSGYADEVGRRALDETAQNEIVPDTRLMLIDYGTNLEVLVANMLMSDKKQRKSLLESFNLKNIYSFRCVIQLAHSAAPKAGNKRRVGSTRKGIQLTDELEQYLDNLKRCATCYTFNEQTETYTFDYWVDEQTETAFQSLWTNTLHLYASFHKFAMLNDLAISKKTRDRFKRETKARRFASRLPEPQDEDKVFRFERVTFVAQSGDEEVDYVSLSDGEHQLGQLLGTFCMLSLPDVLFLLDEPESHFNPQWRVKFISRILNLPTEGGNRTKASNASEQECLLTTHSPFVPSDLSAEKVFIFSKTEGGEVLVRHPDIETYGTTFDTIVEECFGVRPPISDVPLQEIEKLMESDDPAIISEGIERLGHSVEKVFLVDRLSQLTSKDED